MENMKEKIEIGLDEEGKVVVESNVKTMDFFKKAIRCIKIVLLCHLADKDENLCISSSIGTKADALIKEALEDNEHA